MGIHDAYGKQVMQAAAGRAFIGTGPNVCIDYGAGGAQIDGTVAGSIAVEIEARTPKQVRGAILDLLCHPFPKKLLVLVPANMRAEQTAIQCSTIFARFGLSASDAKVLVLRGSGATPAVAEDVALIRGTLGELGFVAEGPPTVARGRAGTGGG